MKIEYQIVNLELRNKLHEFNFKNVLTASKKQLKMIRKFYKIM